MRFQLFIISVVLMFSALVFAQGQTLSYSIKQPHYTSLRAQGMGGAYTAVVDNYDALLYNPAALARLQQGQVNVGIALGGSPNFLDLKKDIDATNSQTGSAKNQAIADAIVKNYGNNYYLNAPSLSAFWVRPGWGFGFIPLDVSFDMSIHQYVGPQVNVDAYNDSTVAFGYAKNVNNGLSIGGTAKAVYRAHSAKAVSAVELALDSSALTKLQDVEEGVTFDFDAGVMYNPYWKWQLFKPTLGLTVRNVIDYGFKQNLKLINKTFAAEPPPLQRRVDFGTMWEIPSFWIFSPRLAVDMKDMGHRYWTFKKGLHIGAELLWKAFSWLNGAYRVGLNQGYLTAGVSAEFAWFNLDLAYWGEEVGTTDSPQRNDRVMAKFNLDF